MTDIEAVEEAFERVTAESNIPRPPTHVETDNRGYEAVWEDLNGKEYRCAIPKVSTDHMYENAEDGEEAVDRVVETMVNRLQESMALDGALDHSDETVEVDRHSLSVLSHLATTGLGDNPKFEYDERRREMALEIIGDATELSNPSSDD